MKKIFSILVSFVILSSLFVIGCNNTETEKLKVVTSTSLLAKLVERVGGDYVSVVNIIPPAQCPGHFDVKAGDIQLLVDAKLFLIHNWQGEKFSDSLIASANNRDLTTVQVEIAGNWMTPTVQREAADKIAEILSQVDPENSIIYQDAADQYKAAVTAKETKVIATLNHLNPSSINVLCDEQQAGFVRWAGFNIVSTYGRPDTFTPQVVQDLVDQGRDENVTVVIDNMQTGGEAGKSLAEELDVAHIVLSNFPGGYENTDTWEEAIDKNVEIIINAVSK